MRAEACLSWYSARAEADPASAAVVLQTYVLSYAGLWERIVERSRLLSDSGLRPRQRIVIDSAADEGKWIVALLAALAAGAQAILPDSDWSPARRSTAVAALSPAFHDDGDRISRVQSPAARQEGVGNPGVWLFTSGTTNEPEPHFRSLDLIRAMVDRVRARWPHALAASRPRVFSTAPLSHGFGLINALLLPHAMGGTLIVDDFRAAAQTVARIAALEPQALLAWPAHYRNMADAKLWPERNGLTWCVSSSFRLEPEIARRFADCAGCLPRSQYGMTETGPLCLDGAVPPIAAAYCVGSPLAGVAMTALDANGAALPAGAKGRLCTRVDGVALTAPGDYWDTGDVGSIDDRGNVFVYGRSSAFTDERKEFHL